MKRKPLPAPPGRSHDAINWLNIGLMLGACGAAITAPYHVFLFAYAFLGPLHYLTEISWLHDRKYFARRDTPRLWWLVLVAFTIVVLIFTYAAAGSPSGAVSPAFGNTLIYLVFASAAVAIYARDWRIGIGILAAVALGLSLLSEFPIYAWAVLAVIFLTTIIHVFVFTGSFILLGALKSRSWVGGLSLFIFLACAVAAVTVNAPFAAPTAYVRQLYLSFEFLNRALLLLFTRTQDVYEPVGAGVMRLIAFAYLYHYLNWFSKTSIIKWHEVGRIRGVAILGFWLSGGAIYLYNYRLGLGVFYILSLLHVFLEFPLNHQTFVEIGKALSGRNLRGYFGGQQKSPAPNFQGAGN